MLERRHWTLHGFGQRAMPAADQQKHRDRRMGEGTSRRTWAEERVLVKRTACVFQKLVQPEKADHDGCKRSSEEQGSGRDQKLDDKMCSVC